jgi:hypothetical protein
MPVPVPDPAAVQAFSIAVVLSVASVVAPYAVIFFKLANGGCAIGWHIGV